MLKRILIVFPILWPKTRCGWCWLILLLYRLNHTGSMDIDIWIQWYTCVPRLHCSTIHCFKEILRVYLDTYYEIIFGNKTVKKPSKNSIGAYRAYYIMKIGSSKIITWTFWIRLAIYLYILLLLIFNCLIANKLRTKILKNTTKSFQQIFNYFYFLLPL